MSIGESKRPSLMTGTAGKPAEQPASPRILADMEGLPSARPKRAARKMLRPILLFCLLGCVGILGWMLLARGDSMTSSSDADDLAASMPAPARSNDRSADMAPAAQPANDVRDTAVIVDDPTVDDGSQALASIGSPAGAATADNPPAATTTQAASSSTGNAAAVRDMPPAGIASRAASRQRTLAKRTAARPGEPDLLATLMANIGGTRDTASNTAPPSARNRAAGESSAMDELVANIRNNRDENYTPSATALGTIASGSSDDGTTTAMRQLARSADIQSELRSCPKANTVRGIECRKRICSKYAGQDAACPR